MLLSTEECVICNQWQVDDTLHCAVMARQIFVCAGFNVCVEPKYTANNVR